MIKTYVESIRKAVEEQNWYAALALALAIPDICGSIEQPKRSSSKRYVSWYNKFVAPRFREVFSDATGSLLLRGSDCYALRCSFLHNGFEDISEQQAQRVLETFYFVEPLKNWSFNTRARGTMLIIQVDRFCLLICNAADSWLDNRGSRDFAEQSFLIIRNPRTDGIPL
jgi:hypothetical protein